MEGKPPRSLDRGRCQLCCIVASKEQRASGTESNDRDQVAATVILAVELLEGVIVENGWFTQTAADNIAGRQLEQGAVRTPVI